MSTAIARTDEPSGLLRSSLLGLAVLGSASGLVELATLRHWNSTEQLVPWIVLIVVAALAVAVWSKASPALLRLARLVAIGAVASSMFGMFEHIKENYDTAPLDRHYGPLWNSMSSLSKVWHAATGSVGPSPLLAPGLLAQAGLCLALATVAHPAFRQGDTLDPAMLLGAPSGCE